VLLMQAAFSYRPRLLLWTGLSVAAAWTLGFLWIACRPETLLDPPGKLGRASMLSVYLDPNYASALKYQNEVVVFLLVSAGLALLVRRSRSVVAERAEGRARARQPGALLLAQGGRHPGRARRAAGARAPSRGGRALRRSRGLQNDGGGDDAGRGDGTAARFPRPDGGSRVPPQRLPGKVHRRRAARDVRRAGHGPAGCLRHHGLRARHAGRAVRLERRANGGGAAGGEDGARPPLRPGRGRRHRESPEHGLRYRGG